MFFKAGDYVYLRLYRGYKMTGVQSRKLGQQFVGLFKISERINRLVYRLKLPSTIKIHDVIFVIHLEPATIPESDPYNRRSVIPPPVIVDNEEEYEIKRLIRKRQRRFGRTKHAITQYLIR